MLLCDKCGIFSRPFRGVNYGFYYHLGCSEQNTNIFSHQVSFIGVRMNKSVTIRRVSPAPGNRQRCRPIELATAKLKNKRMAGSGRGHAQY